MTDLRYPIGEFRYPGPLGPAARRECVARIAAAPGRLRAAVAGLSERQLDIPYRPDGWTPRQVVHHVPDSHVNGYVRFRLALTQEVPTIATYDEAAWARLPDVALSVDCSLTLLDALHARWVLLLERLGEGDWARMFHHPGYGRNLALDEALALYAWHGDHHTAHITSLRARMGWGGQTPAPP